MNGFTFKAWRAVGVAATLSLAACGGEAGSGGEAGGEGGEGGGEAGEAAATAPAQAGGREGGGGGEGGEAGEAGAASAYAGVSGEQLTALRIEHLKGFVLAAERVLGEDQPAEAGVLVQQGLLEVYDIAPDQFGSLNVELVRAAGDSALDRAQLTTRVRAALTELDRALGALSDVDHAALAARMVDIATGLYQNVNQADYVDTIEYQHSMGAAYAARSALTLGRTALRGENQRAFTDAETEMNRFVGLWAAPAAPEQPPAYRDVLAQGSRVRLALSPYL